MGLDRRMQCFIDQLFPIIWSRYLIPEELRYLPEPSGQKFREISPALIELLSKAIWVQSKIAFHHWVRYLRRYYDKMVSSPKMFVTYVIYACNTMGYNIQDHYERFVTVCSLLVGFGANFYYSGNGEVLRYIPQILAVFFERVLSAPFNGRGGWKRLDRYLLRQEYLNWHDEIQIESPNETPQERVTRELNFARKVEAAIQASACKDYDVDAINEKDVECDLATVQITDEVIQCLSETGPKKKGSKKPKSGATSQHFDEAVVEAKKDVAKGMMAVVQRARLDALLKSQRPIEEGSVSSGTTVNIPFSEAVSNVPLKTGMVKQPDIKIEEPGSKRKKTKKRKASKTKDGIPNIPEFIEETANVESGAVSKIINKTEVIVIQKPDNQSEDCAGKPLKPKKQKASKTKEGIPNIPQFIEETYEANVESGAVSKIINKTEVIVIQKPDNQSEDCARKPLKTKKQKASKTKENKLLSSPLSVEKIKRIIYSDLGDNNESDKAHTEQVNENKSIELNEDGKLCIAKRLSDSTFKDNSENLQQNKCTTSNRAVEERNKLNMSHIPETTGTFSMHKNARNTLQDEGTKTIQEQIVDNSEQKSEDIIDENSPAVNVSCNVKCSEDASLNSKLKENGGVSNPEPSIERNIQNETLGLEDIGDISANGTSSNTTYTKYKTKREAMNEVIRIVDGLSPKIEMFVVMLDSLVWDLKKDS